MEEEDRIYNAAFDKSYAMLKERLIKSDGSFDLPQAKSLLQTLYMKEGTNWSGGRGSYSELSDQAELAALQSLIAQYAKEL